MDKLKKSPHTTATFPATPHDEDVTLATWLQGIELIHKGYDNDEIADIVDVAVRTVRRWRRNLNDNGEEHLSTKKKVQDE